MKPHFSLFFRTDAWILCLILLLGSLGLALLGKMLRNKFFQQEEILSKDATGSLIGAMFGLWAFVLAFSFANSASRFDSVHNILVEEYNAISNAIYWTDAFPDKVRDSLRSELRVYVDERIGYYNNARDYEKFVKAREDAVRMGKSIWGIAVRASTQPNLTAPSMNLLNALSVMRNVATRRDELLISGVPDLIIYMLFLLTFPVAFFCGFTTHKTRHLEWAVIGGFLLLATIIFYITLDLGRPMRSSIKGNLGEERMVELRKAF